ncbi:hypothetical protein J1614_004384 [Plenodomus biglobosus]|nr:hypothetical protein J1614_004384 [Plenodomus biglobosus]
MPAEQLHSLPLIPSTAWDETNVKWVNQCRIHHNHPCNAILAAEALPTRILELDLGDNSMDVRLRSGEDVQAESYNILSYRWDPSQPLVTTTLNLMCHLERIPWASLSILFQEAINITRTIGIRALWMDALCIVQDDQEDWERESQNMSSYNGNTCLTISASASHSPKNSILLRLPSKCILNKVPTLEYVHVQKIPVHFNLRATRFKTSNPKCIPLLRRAWAYERLLSRRILHLGPEGAVWEYRKASWCECSQRPDLWHGLLDTKFDAFVISHFSALFNMDRISGYWQTLLEMYMTRAIEYETDRLRAIQGLATQINGFWASYTSADTGDKSAKCVHARAMVN